MMNQSAYVFRYRAMPLWLAVLGSALVMMPTAGIFTVVFECQSVMWLVGGMSLIVGAVLSRIAPASEVKLDADGLNFPVSMARDLALRLKRPWSDVSAVWLESKRMPPLDQTDLDEEPESGAGNPEGTVARVQRDKKLVLYFKSGGFAEFSLSLMAKDDLKVLLTGIHRWGEETFRAPDVDELQKQLTEEGEFMPGGGHAQTQATFTKMWEDDLCEHFGTTTFVPLKKNKELQDGSLVIRKQLAYGGLSAVYLASGQSPDSETVVVKESVVPAQTQEGALEKARELFEREALLLMKLSHPQIARVKDHFVEAGRNYLVLQYVEGQSLRQFVKLNGAQPEKVVLEWAREIAQVLSYLHRQNPPIIHRDLTPENIVLTRDGTPVIIDFGAAVEFLETATGTLIGKQSYIAPEQFRGRAKPISDLYSLGATMYFLLTADDPEALSESHPLKGGASVSQETDHLVAMLTRVEEPERVATADCALDAISRLLAQPSDEEPLEAFHAGVRLSVSLQEREVTL